VSRVVVLRSLFERRHILVGILDITTVIITSTDIVVYVVIIIVIVVVVVVVVVVGRVISLLLAVVELFIQPGQLTHVASRTKRISQRSSMR